LTIYFCCYFSSSERREIENVNIAKRRRLRMSIFQHFSTTTSNK
jgi:hypothetical protein